MYTKKSDLENKMSQKNLKESQLSQRSGILNKRLKRILKDSKVASPEELNRINKALSY